MGGRHIRVFAFSFFVFGILFMGVSRISLTGDVIGGSLFPSFSFIIGIVLFLVSILLFMMEIRIEEKLEQLNPIIIKSKISSDPSLLKISQKIGRRHIEAKDINNLFEELRNGNLSNAKMVGDEISSLEGSNGGKIYFREINDREFEILAYSNDEFDVDVLNRLKILYPSHGN